MDKTIESRETSKVSSVEESTPPIMTVASGLNFGGIVSIYASGLDSPLVRPRFRAATINFSRKHKTRHHGEPDRSGGFGLK